MAFKHEKNEGSFFINDYKTEKKHPTYRGECNMEGKTMDIAVWHNEAKDGKKENWFFRITEPREKKQSNVNSTSVPQFDEIPH